MPNLYQVSTNIKQAIDEVLSLEGDIDQQCILDTVDGIKGELEVKQKNVAAFILNTQYDINCMKDYEKSMADRRKRLEKSIEWLTGSLFSSMKLHDIAEIKTPEFSVKIKKNPTHVVVNNENLIPDEYWRVKTIKEVDKARIKEALASNIEIAGAHLENTEKLIIK